MGPAQAARLLTPSHLAQRRAPTFTRANAAAGACLGQHNDLVLGEVLGLRPSELERLAERDIIGTEPLGQLR